MCNHENWTFCQSSSIFSLTTGNWIHERISIRESSLNKAFYDYSQLYVLSGNDTTETEIITIILN